ncbi:MAG: hypothetical protein SCI25_15510 [Desulfuromonadales bacterium]|nr:hypothetical protein [Desulfuromonadales bacterium]MDW7758439.1 hypothetical protein [Desulfuromonadales bacterium]
MEEVAAIAMTVNAFKTSALFAGKTKEIEKHAPSASNGSPEIPPGKT